MDDKPCFYDQLNEDHYAPTSYEMEINRKLDALDEAVRMIMIYLERIISSPESPAREVIGVLDKAWKEESDEG